MTETKKNTLLQEIALYLPYDKNLSQAQKTKLLDLNRDAKEGWAQTVYDYFYSHVDDEGNILSVENFLLKHPDHSARYKKANDAFVNNLFINQKPLFFLDVDNTLTDEGYLSKEKIEFLSNFEQKERIILTTGKAYESIKNVIQDCDLWDNYASCLNGSVLVQKGKTECIAKVGSVSRQIVKLFADAPFDCVVYYEDGIRLLRPLSQKNLQLLKKYNENYAVEEVINFSRVVKVLFFIYEGETQKEELVKSRIQRFSDLVAMRTAGHTFEVLNKKQHKGNTVKIISNLLNRYYRNTVGVGDSMNDFQLLNYVGKPFVVATANQQLKSAGYEISDQNRDIDIVNVIKRYQ